MGKNRFPAVMQTVALLSGIATGLLVLFCQRWPLSWLLTLSISLGTTFYHFAMRLLAGATVPLLAGRLRPDHFWFRQHSWEHALYKILRVRKWKGKLPTYDPSQFDLAQNTPAQVVRNMCTAELVHEVIVILSFMPLLLAIPFGELPVFLITSIFAALYDSIFIVAQRYNRPRLARVLQKKEVQP